MPDVFALSEQDRDTLRRLLGRSEGSRYDTPLQSGVRTIQQPVTNYLTPETYIAYPQTSGGIPARSGLVPGSAVCDIYNLIGSSPTITSTGLSLTVYNLSEDALDQAYLLIHRDKYGYWIAGTGSGGGGGTTQIVHFRIQSVDCVTRCGIGTVLARNCGNATVGDDIQIYDAAGCFFAGDETTLLNLEGYAVLMHGEDPCPGTGTWIGTGTTQTTTAGCVWHVFSLCCPIEAC